MKKISLLALLGRIFATLAFVIMLIYGFINLILNKFESYDMAVLKMIFFVPNLAQSLWNLLIIIAFFTFTFWIIWNVSRKPWFIILGMIFSIIGSLTFIFLVINDLRDTNRLAVGLSLSLLLITNGILWFLTGYWMEKRSKIDQNFLKKKLEKSKQKESV